MVVWKENTMFDRMPLISSEVEVTTSFKESYLFSDSEFRFTTYRGKVINSACAEIVKDTNFSTQGNKCLDQM